MDRSLASDRLKCHDMVAYTQLVSCSIRNDAGPMELQEAEVCLDGKGRPSNLRRSRGILHVDSYTPFTIEVDCSVYFEHHKRPRVDPHDPEHHYDDIQAELFFDKQLITRLVTDHKSGLEKIIFAGESLEEQHYRKFKFTVSTSSFHTTRLNCSPSNIVILIKRVKLGMEQYYPLIPSREAASNQYDLAVLETHVRPEDASFRYQMFTISCSLSHQHPAVRHEMMAPPSDRPADHPVFKAQARSAQLPQAPVNPQNTFFVGNPYGTSVGEPILDTAQALAEICSTPVSPASPSPLVPSFDSPERPRPAMLLPLSPELTPVSSQKSTFQRNSCIGYGVPCSSQASRSTPHERKKTVSGRDRPRSAREDEERFWRGSDDFLRNDLASLLNSSGSSLSSAPESPVPSTSELPGISIGTAPKAADFVNAVLSQEKIPQRTQRYQDLVGQRRGPDLHVPNASHDSSTIQLRQPTPLIAFPNTENSGLAESTRETLGSDAMRSVPATERQVSASQLSAVDTEENLLPASSHNAVSAANVQNIASVTPRPVEAVKTGSCGKISDDMDIDFPAGDIEDVVLSDNAMLSGRIRNKQSGESSAARKSSETVQSAAEAAAKSSRTIRPAIALQQTETTASSVTPQSNESTETNGTTGRTNPLVSTVSVSPPADSRSSRLKALFSKPAAVTKDHALIDDVLVAPPSKKAKTMRTSERSSSESRNDYELSIPAASRQESDSRDSTPVQSTIARFTQPSPKPGDSPKQTAPLSLKVKSARPSWKFPVTPEQNSVEPERTLIPSGNAHPGSTIPRLRLTVSTPLEVEQTVTNRQSKTVPPGSRLKSAHDGKSSISNSASNLTTTSTATDLGQSTSRTVAKFRPRTPPSPDTTHPERVINTHKAAVDRLNPSIRRTFDRLGAQEVGDPIPADVLRAVRLMDRRVLLKNVPLADRNQTGEKRKRSAF